MAFYPQELTYHILSLGCFKNQSDSEFLNGALLRAGFSPAAEENEADIVIINTCGFIEDAKRESLQEIFSVEKDLPACAERPFKRRLVVCGCLSQRYMEQMKEEIPEIDLLYGLVDDALVDEIAAAFDIGLSRQKSSAQARVPLSPLPYEYIKISEGCSNNCSFCAIPLIRGARRSFSPQSIIDDARSAIDRGAVELVLIAQDTASYDYEGTMLSDLLYRIAELQPRLMRVMYMHPDRINKKILDTMADISCIAPYLDLPFQHADGRILASMNRNGNADRYLDLLSQIRETIRGISVRSTFMVGYPGEDDRSFSQLEDFVQRAQLDRAGFFMYSREEGTPAFSLGDVPQKTKVARYNRLSLIQEDITRNRLSALIGRKVRVIVEEHSGGDQWIGRSELDAPEIDGIFFLTGRGDILNTMVEAEITDSVEFDLVGEL